jgi:hypothetical protein
MSELLQVQVRSIGEHYVVARLTTIGFIVGLAPENTKAVDIIAMSGDGKRNFQIQVKTRTAGRSADNGWMMSEKHESIATDNLYYVFVSLPEEWTDREQPSTYIIPSKKVAAILKQSHRDWKTTPGKKGQKRNDTKMRRIAPIYKDSPTIKTDWMEEYRDNWKILE